VEDRGSSSSSSNSNGSSSNSCSRLYPVKRSPVNDVNTLNDGRCATSADVDVVRMSGTESRASTSQLAVCHPYNLGANRRMIASQCRCRCSHQVELRRLSAQIVPGSPPMAADGERRPQRGSARVADFARYIWQQCCRCSYRCCNCNNF
jgi:hypothetical protein